MRKSKLACKQSKFFLLRSCKITSRPRERLVFPSSGARSAVSLIFINVVHINAKYVSLEVTKIVFWTRHHRVNYCSLFSVYESELRGMQNYFIDWIKEANIRPVILRDVKTMKMQCVWLRWFALYVLH